MGTQEASASWNGSLKEGNGSFTLPKAGYSGDFSFATRFESADGTNPEELIAAAHAGCFNMKLSFVLNESDFHPEELSTQAVLTFEDGKILSIDLNLEAKVPNISPNKFIELAEDAKENCPISGALNCKINLHASLI